MAQQLTIDVLYEDNHVLVVNKPAGLATQGVAAGTPSVVTQAKAYLKHKHHKPGNVFLGVVSRLDSTTSGLLVLARTSKAADRLTKQFHSGTVEKTYWALIERPPNPASGELTDWVLKNDRQRRMEIVPRRSPGAQQARLSYVTLRRERLGTLLEVRLHTGRKHQIRLQLSAIDCPILGDRKYGSHQPFGESAIALHCVRLAFEHPTTHQRLEFAHAPPPTWNLSKP